jgi:5-(carboxyamino)imidazole ribonucleotide mutase
VEIASAHRTPDRVAELARGAADEGYGVVIAAAGLAAALPGVMAAHTSLPVIGLPVGAGPLRGVDALLGIVMMPAGVPVAAVGIDGGANAGHLALRILGRTPDR